MHKQSQAKALRAEAASLREACKLDAISGLLRCLRRAKSRAELLTQPCVNRLANWSLS